MGDVENGEAKEVSFTKVQPMSEKPKRVPSRPNLAKTDSALQLVDEASRRAIVRMASHEESVAKTTSFGVRATISHEDSMNAHLTHVRDRLNWLTSGETSVDVPDATDALKSFMNGMCVVTSVASTSPIISCSWERGG